MLEPKHGVKRHGVKRKFELFEEIAGKFEALVEF